MKHFLLIGFMLIVGMQAEEVQLNLPERFDINIPVKAIKYKSFIQKVPSVKIFVNGNSFTINQPKHKYMHTTNITNIKGGAWTEFSNSYVSLKGGGIFKNGEFIGNVIVEFLMYQGSAGLFTSPSALTHDTTIKYKISAKSDSNGRVKIKLIKDNIIKCLTPSVQTYDGEKHTIFYDPLVPCQSKYYKDLPKYPHSWVPFQLPINQSQSQQKFIADPNSETEESTSITDQPITLPKATFSADLSANQELQGEPEQEEYLDEAMIEYRKKEKERITREKAEDMGFCFWRRYCL